MNSKYTEISFACKPEKIELLKEYAKKNNIPFYSAVNILESSVPDFEKFLKENDVYDDEFGKFLEDLLKVMETNFAVPARNKALLKELKDYASKQHFNVSIKGTVATATMPESIFNSECFKTLMLKLETEFEKEMEEKI